MYATMQIAGKGLQNINLLFGEEFLRASWLENWFDEFQSL
jgi:hypothetical protein